MEIKYNSKLFPPEILSFILDNYSGISNSELLNRINEKFGTSYQLDQIVNLKHRLHLRSGYRFELFNPEIQAFIASSYEGISSEELQKMVNEKFGTAYTVNQIYVFKKNNGLRSGYDARFKAGVPSRNKGKKLEEIMRPEAAIVFRANQFKKGHAPKNRLYDGAETFRPSDGCWFIRVDGKWLLKSRVMYERYHGVKLREDELVTFLDGNTSNFEKENLEKISKGENLRMCEYRTKDRELTRAGLSLIRLERKIRDKEDKDGSTQL